MANTTIPSLSFDCQVISNKKEAREWRNMFFPPHTRPEHVSPRKKVSWRLVKKWFNRYEKPRSIGGLIGVDTKEGTQIKARITDVRISKAGGHKRTYDFTCAPIEEPKWP